MDTRAGDAAGIPAGLVAPRCSGRGGVGGDPRPPRHGLRGAGRPPPVTGLYTTIACLVAYAMFGPSKVLVLGPDSSVSPLILAAIVPLVVADDPASAITLAGMLAIMVGLIEIGLGVARLGFVADLLSSEVRVGYLNGLAVTIIVGQLPKLFGFSTDADSFVDEMRAFFNGLDGRSAATLATGVCVLAVLLVLPRITRRIPAVLVAVVGATIVSAVFDLAAHGVATVGALPQGVPRPALPWTSWQDVGAAARRGGGHHHGVAHRHDRHGHAASPPAAATRSTPTRRWSGSARQHRRRASSRASPFRCSGSRTAVADQAGAKPQVTGLVGAGLVRVLLLFLNGLLADLPAVRPGRGRDHRGAVAHRPARAAPLRHDPAVSTRPQPGRHRRRDLLRRAAGHRRRHRVGGAAVLPTQLVAARRRARRGAGARRLAQPQGLPRGPGASRHRRVPLGGPALLRQRRRSSATSSGPSCGTAGPAGSSCSARPSPTST